MSSSDASALLPIARIQALYFELIKTIRYNELDGERVVADLLRWRGLWDSVIADRQPTPRLSPTTGRPTRSISGPTTSACRTCGV